MLIAQEEKNRSVKYNRVQKQDVYVDFHKPVYVWGYSTELASQIRGEMIGLFRTSS